MRSPSTDFKDAMKAPVKQIDGKLIIDPGVDEITSGDDLIRFTVTGEAKKVGNSVMRQLTADYLGTRNLVGQVITVKFGVKLPSTSYEYITVGEFLVTQCEINKEKETTKLIGYDRMIYTALDYTSSFFAYPTTVGGLYEQIADTTTVDVETSTIPFEDLDIDIDYYENISGTQYRKMIEDIAVLGGNIAMIDENGEISLRNVKTPTNTVETITYSDLKKLTVKSKYGSVNSLVLSRQPQEDNIFLRSQEPATYEITTVDATANTLEIVTHGFTDGALIKLATTDTLPAPLAIDTSYYVYTDTEADTFTLHTTKADAIAGTSAIDITNTGTGTHSIVQFDLTEVKIANNELIDKRRDEIAEDMLDYFEGTEFYPFKADTIGLGWYEVGDKLLVTDDEAITREVRVMGVKLTVDGSIKETLWSEEPTTPETNYSYASGIRNDLKNTEIVVDKQKQEIASIIEQVDTIDGYVNENFTRVDQDISNIISTVQQSGGSNLIKNSAFYAYNNDNEPEFWTEYTGAGSAIFSASPEAVSYGSISGHIARLDDIGFQQIVAVVQDNGTIDEEDKIYYSFSCRIKKETVGNIAVIITDGITEWKTEIAPGTSKLWEEIAHPAILPKNNTLTVKVYGDSASEFEITDMMLVMGEYQTNWQQANGEVMNTQVNIHSKGITIKSNIFLGDYTVISPTEFAGYAIINGTLTKVFTLNKDVTEVKKLQAEDEITMEPIKIVPLNNANQEGWAFVGIGE